METGITQYAYFSGGGFDVRVKLPETYDALENYSEVPAESIEFKSDTFSGDWYPGGTLSMDGSTVGTMNYNAPATHVVSIYNLGSWYPLTAIGSGQTFPWASGKIYHNADGSKTLTVTLNITLYSSSWQSSWGSYPAINQSVQIQLTHIPQASTIGATDANIGAVSMIAVSRKSEAYTHSIAYQFGSETGYITADGGTTETEVKFTAASVAFRLPESFYSQIPSTKSGVVALTCRTYAGDTRIGEDQTATFNATAEETASRPVVSGTVEDSNAATIALTGDAGKLVRCKSNALCAITTAARNGASIAQKTIDGTAVEGDTLTIDGIEVSSVTFAAADSRGYSASVSVPVDLVPYVILTCNLSADRTDPTSGNAVLTVKGNYYNGGFGAVENTLEIKYRISGADDYQAAEALIDGNSYSAEIHLSGLDYKTQYGVEVVVSDKLDSVSKTARIKKGVPVVDWGENDWKFNVPIVVADELFGPAPPSTGLKGQLFFQENGDGTYTLRIHNGISW